MPSLLPINPKHLLHTEAESEAIADLRYDVERQQLEISFNKRGTYVFYDFPPDEYANFNQATSRGTYFNLYIRNAGYNYERIS